MLNYLIFGISYAFAAAVQPGPLQTYIISQVFKKGWKASIPLAFSPIISDIPISILTLYLLSNVPDVFINGLRIIGGLFLFFLAYKAYISWKTYIKDENNLSESNQLTFFNAVLINLLNPGPYIGWSLILGPLVLEAWSLAPKIGIALIFCFYSTMIITLIGIIILFAFAKELGPKVSKSIIGISSIGLFMFGIYQLYRGVIFFI